MKRECVSAGGGLLDYIPLEQPIVDLEEKIALLRRMAATQRLDLDADIKKLEHEVSALQTQIFSRLTAYETVQLSRHPLRPNGLDTINHICSKFVEFHGDRNFYDDPAIVGGVAELDGWQVVVITHQKGRGTSDNIARNFGMPKPEGYRKALRLMMMADKFKLPIITLIDTPGAYPGVGAEERGQSEAIGRCIMTMSQLQVPIITVVIGEGGSGGALAIGVANRVHMLEYAIYSVISPEGCASILLKDAEQATAAAESLQLTAAGARRLNLVDSVIVEPCGGGHRDADAVAQSIKQTLRQDLQQLMRLTPAQLRQQRAEKFRAVSFFTTAANAC